MYFDQAKLGTVGWSRSRMHGRLPATDAAATESLYDACGNASLTISTLSCDPLKAVSSSASVASSLSLPAEWVQSLSCVRPPAAGWAAGAAAAVVGTATAAVVGVATAAAVGAAAGAVVGAVVGLATGAVVGAAVCGELHATSSDASMSSGMANILRCMEDPFLLGDSFKTNE